MGVGDSDGDGGGVTGAHDLGCLFLTIEGHGRLVQTTCSGLPLINRAVRGGGGDANYGLTLHLDGKGVRGTPIDVLTFGKHLVGGAVEPEFTATELGSTEATDASTTEIPSP